MLPLIKLLAKYQHVSAEKYSLGLYKNLTPVSISVQLYNAFYQEFTSRGFSAKDLLNNLAQWPILQTAHHQCPTNGPSFMAIDFLACCGLPKDQNYLVATYSAIPFSNNAQSSALVFEQAKLQQLISNKQPYAAKIAKSLMMSTKQGSNELKIALCSNRYKQDLVFNSPQLNLLLQLWPQLEPEISSSLPNPQNYNDYNDWAMDCNQFLQRWALEKDNIYYFDINRVVKNYLLNVLDGNYGHCLINSLLLDKKLQYHCLQQGINLKLFCDSKIINGKPQLSIITLQNVYDSWPDNFSDIKTILQKKRLCPSLFTVFSILLLESNLKLLGSFLQYQYLPRVVADYQKIAKIADWQVRDHDFSQANIFCSGRLPARTLRYPLDMFINKQRIDKLTLANKPLHYFWQELPSKLLT